MPFFNAVLRIVLCGFVTFIVSAVHAYDQQLTSSLYASGYSIRAANGTLIDRRNIVEELYLGAWHILPGSDDPYYRGPRLSLEVDLRVGGDYGIENSETDASRLDRYVPGLQAMDMEAVFAYVALEGLAGDHLDVSAGRIIRTDAIGYTAFDGVGASVHWPFGLSVRPFWGYEVQSSKPFGYDNLSLDGVDNAGRDELDDAWFATLVESRPTMKFGAEVSLVPSGVLDIALAYQQAGYGRKLQQQTIGGHLALSGRRIRSFGRIVANPFLDRYDNVWGALRQGTLVTEASAEVSAQVVPKCWLSLSWELYRPVFTIDSIFNLFGQLGRRDLVLRFEQRFTPTVQWASWSSIRFADDKGVSDEAEQDSWVIGGGGGAGLNLGSFVRSLSARASIEKELGSLRFGVEQELGHRFFNDRLWVSVRGSLWHIRDSLYGTRKTIGGYVVSANHQFTERARTIFEFENYYGADIPRFVLTALLQLDLWR
jgi:hypothetical protein